MFSKLYTYDLRCNINVQIKDKHRIQKVVILKRIKEQYDWIHKLHALLDVHTNNHMFVLPSD